MITMESAAPVQAALENPDVKSAVAQALTAGVEFSTLFSTIIQWVTTHGSDIAALVALIKALFAPKA